MRRVVVTGMGAVTPVGIGIENFWNSIKEKKTGFDKITKFDTTGFKASLAAEIKDFDPKEFIEAGMLMLYKANISIRQRKAKKSGSAKVYGRGKILSHNAFLGFYHFALESDLFQSFLKFFELFLGHFFVNFNRYFLCVNTLKSTFLNCD